MLHASLTPSPTPQREELRYVRFEHATEIIRGITYGPFTYVDEARDILVGSDRAELDDVMSWFNDNLEEPERMVPFRDVGERRARRRRRQEALAQCWFREDAEAHIVKARELVMILERAGFAFVERWSDRLPGKFCGEEGTAKVLTRRSSLRFGVDVTSEVRTSATTERSTR